MSTPRVALVGAGPGDPELLTLRAEGVLSAAAIVVSDAAAQGLARGFAPRAELVVVADGRPAVPQLLSAVAGGRDVVRLYAGDPWLSPAHGEELSALKRAGVATEAIPGVATEVAVPARAGIAVNVRHLAFACTLGSAEEMPTSADPARTLLVPCEDGAAAARLLAARGGRRVPAAILPLDDGPDEARGALGDLAGGASSGPSLLVVGAVAATTPATPDTCGHAVHMLPEALESETVDRMRGGQR